MLRCHRLGWDPSEHGTVKPLVNTVHPSDRLASLLFLSRIPPEISPVWTVPTIILEFGPSAKQTRRSNPHAQPPQSPYDTVP